MKTLKDYTDEEIRSGIERCKKRLSGLMSKGIMSDKQIKEALSEYRAESQRRGIKYLEFTE